MKSKTPLIILALVLLAAAAPVPPLLAPGGLDQAFTLALDRLAGPGRWSARRLEAQSDLLTVEGLSINLPPSLSEAASGVSPSVLTIERLSLKSGLTKRQAKKILTAGHWKNQPETLLAENLRLVGLRHQATRPEGRYEAQAVEMTADQARLGPGGPNATAGPAGFLKALRLGAFGYKELRITLKGREAEAASSVQTLTAKGLEFGGPLDPELVKLDLSGLLISLAGLSAENLKAEGLALSFTGQAQELPITVSLTLDSLEETDLRALKAVGSLQMRGLKGELSGRGGMDNLKATLALDALRLSGLEISDYPRQALTAAAASKKRLRGEAEKTLNLAGFFASPLSLAEASLSGLEFDLTGLVRLKLAESRITGPFKTGEIPPRQKSSLQGLDIILFEDLTQTISGLANLVRWQGWDILVRDFGLNRFVWNLEAESVYDPQTGSLLKRINELRCQDLFGLTAGLEWGGLTPERLEKLKTTPLSAVFKALKDPDLLGGASLKTFNLQYTDQGLTERILQLAENLNGQRLTGEALREKVVKEFELGMRTDGPKNLKNIEALIRPLAAFLQSPQSLELSLKSEPPPRFSALLGAAPAEAEAMLNALHITVSANGQAGEPLEFTLPADSDEGKGKE